MKVAALVSRILLGVLFTISGIFGFVMLFKGVPPPPPGLAGKFFEVYAQSHWLQWVDGFQLLVGLLLLAGIYVPLALLMLAPILVNILIFHVTMMPQGILPGLIASILWLILAVQYRPIFDPLLRPKILLDSSGSRG